jgi:TRAP-type C4-dicarboxylate transport system permease small subunit
MPFMPAIRWLYRRAETILALMMGVMFVAFIVQIVSRYFLSFPTGWTSELSVIMWLWMVLWGAAFVIREDEEIRFDLLFWMVPPAARRLMLIIGGLVLIGLYAFSFPAVVDYVTFMKVQSTAYLKIRFDWLFSIYVLFAAAVVIRYAFLVWRAVRNRDMRDADPTEASSGL